MRRAITIIAIAATAVFIAANFAWASNHIDIDIEIEPVDPTGLPDVDWPDASADYFGHVGDGIADNGGGSHGSRSAALVADVTYEIRVIIHHDSPGVDEVVIRGATSETGPFVPLDDGGDLTATCGGEQLVDMSTATVCRTFVTVTPGALSYNPDTIHRTVSDGSVTCDDCEPDYWINVDVEDIVGDPVGERTVATQLFGPTIDPAGLEIRDGADVVAGAQGGTELAVTASGFAPGTTVTIELDSNPAGSVEPASSTADSSGEATATVQLPNLFELEVINFTISASGVYPGGHDVTVSETLNVLAPDVLDHDQLEEVLESLVGSNGFSCSQGAALDLVHVWCESLTVYNHNGFATAHFSGGDEIQVSITSGHEGHPAGVWLLSDPIELWQGTLGVDGISHINATIPSSVTSGSHTVVAVYQGDFGGMFIMHTGVTVDGTDPADNDDNGDGSEDGEGGSDSASSTDGELDGVTVGQLADTGLAPPALAAVMLTVAVALGAATLYLRRRRDPSEPERIVT